MKKEFTIYRDSDRAIFRAYIELLKPFLKGLRSRECDVFAELLYQYYLKSNVTNQRDRFSLVLNENGREVIAKELNISQAVLRNALTSLRKKNLLKDNNTIPNVYLLDLKDKNLNLSFIFAVKE